jgi:hypothetical protein
MLRAVSGEKRGERRLDNQRLGDPLARRIVRQLCRQESRVSVGADFSSFGSPATRAPSVGDLALSLPGRSREERTT